MSKRADAVDEWMEDGEQENEVERRLVVLQPSADLTPAASSTSAMGELGLRV